MIKYQPLSKTAVAGALSAMLALSAFSGTSFGQTTGGGGAGGGTTMNDTGGVAQDDDGFDWGLLGLLGLLGLAGMRRREPDRVHTTTTH